MGESISPYLRTNPEHKNKRYIIAFDLYRRIYVGVDSTLYNFNQLFLTSNRYYKIPLDLALRMCIGDVILGLYLLSKDDVKLHQESDVNDAEHVKAIKDIMAYQYEMGLRLFPNEADPPSKQSYYDKYFEDYRYYLSNNSPGSDWKIKKNLEFRGEGGINERLSVKFMADSMKKSEDEHIKESSILYKYYRILSQTEHYSFKARHYPYILDKSNIITYKEAIIAVHHATAVMRNFLPEIEDAAFKSLFDITPLF